MFAPAMFPVTVKSTKVPRLVMLGCAAVVTVPAVVAVVAVTGPHEPVPSK